MIAPKGHSKQQRGRAGQDKSLVRLAVAIREHAQKGTGRSVSIELPGHAWQQATTLVGQIAIAQRRDWHLAAQQLMQDLSPLVRRLQRELANLDQQLATRSGPHSATVSEFYADLVALREEFPGMDYDQRGGTLSMTTEPIELEGVFLGPFTIVLDWRAGTYRVEADDPHPAASDDRVTHPHVHEKSLCEGEGYSALRAALATGRLLDFFHLVASVLRTYSPSNPFIPLSDWFGSDCSACGDTASHDSRTVCTKCDATLCDDCWVCCESCSDSFCDACTSICTACDERYCSACMAACTQCEADCCSDCLDSQERCPDCHATSHEETPADQAAAVAI